MVWTTPESAHLQADNAISLEESSTVMDSLESVSEASPSIGNDDGTNGNQVRRTGRKRTSTIIQVNGNFVLKQNNYVVKGHTYVHGAFDEDAEKNNQVKKPRKTVTPSTTTEPSVRKQSASEKARMGHNENVKKSIQDKEPTRRAFLVKHQKLLEPFMDEATNRMVLEWGQVKYPAFQKHELFVQPELITGGEMRDYQLAGLNFMVEMHQQNIGMILGDEMGLVRSVVERKSLLPSVARTCLTRATIFISAREKRYRPFHSLAI